MIINLLDEVDKYVRDFWIPNHLGYAYMGQHGSSSRNPITFTNLYIQLPDNKANGYRSQSVGGAPQVFNNKTSTPQKSIATFQATTTDTVSTSTTLGVTAGTPVETTSTFDILFGKEKVTVPVQATFNYSSTIPITTYPLRKWADTVEITLSPYTKVTATYIIDEGTYNLPIQLRCNVIGDAWFKILENEKEGTVIVPIQSVLQTTRPPGFNVYRDHGELIAYFQGTGTLQGSSGINSYIQIREKPLLG